MLPDFILRKDPNRCSEVRPRCSEPRTGSNALKRGQGALNAGRGDLNVRNNHSGKRFPVCPSSVTIFSAALRKTRPAWPASSSIFLRRFTRQSFPAFSYGLAHKRGGTETGRTAKTDALGGLIRQNCARRAFRKAVPVRYRGTRAQHGPPLLRPDEPRRDYLRYWQERRVWQAGTAQRRRPQRNTEPPRWTRGS